MFEKLFSAIFEKVNTADKARRAEIYAERPWIGKSVCAGEKRESKVKEASYTYRNVASVKSLRESFSADKRNAADFRCGSLRENCFLQTSAASSAAYANGDKQILSRDARAYARECGNYDCRLYRGETSENRFNAPYAQAETDVSKFFEDLCGLNVEERELAAEN